MSYPSAMSLKTSSKATPGYTVIHHAPKDADKYPFKWTVYGLIGACAAFWMAMAWLL